MNKFAAIALGATLLVPVGAFAGGATAPITEPKVAPAPMPVTSATAAMDWTGWYGGASLGFGNVNSSGGLGNGNGATGGLLGGYRQDFGSWVGGVEADYNWANTRIGAPGSGISLDSTTHLKLQAGVNVGRTFVYGTAGLVRAGTTVAGVSGTSNGWAAGVGADYALTDNWVLGGEALYNKFNNFGGSGVSGNIPTIEARIAYKF